MSVIDLILNLAGLLLWLKWRDKGQELSGPRISLIGTLRKAGPHQSRLWFLIALLALLIARPLLYWILGSALDWTPRISLGVVSLPFRSDHFQRMVLFSFFSFGAALGIFYSCLLLLSALNGRKVESDPIQNLIREQLGKIDLLPAVLKLLLPWFAMLVIWCVLNKPLVALGMLPAPISFLHLFEQGVVVGLGVYLAWKYLIVGILLLHLLNSYIYFGAWAFWTFIDNSARQISKLVSWNPWLRFLKTLWKIDFAPLITMVLVIFAAKYAERGLVWIYQRLPI